MPEVGTQTMVSTMSSTYQPISMSSQASTPVVPSASSSNDVFSPKSAAAMALSTLYKGCSTSSFSNSWSSSNSSFQERLKNASPPTVQSTQIHQKKQQHPQEGTSAAGIFTTAERPPPRFSNDASIDRSEKKEQWMHHQQEQYPQQSQRQMLLPQQQKQQQQYHAQPQSQAPGPHKCCCCNGVLPQGQNGSWAPVWQPSAPNGACGMPNGSTNANNSHHVNPNVPQFGPNSTTGQSVRWDNASMRLMTEHPNATSGVHAGMPRPSSSTTFVTPTPKKAKLVDLAPKHAEPQAVSSGYPEVPLSQSQLQPLAQAQGNPTRIPYSRKKKSLGVLAENFLNKFNASSPGTVVIVDEAAVELGVERRRIYDVVNILESIQLVIKKGKNTYTWLGKEYLTHVFGKIQEQALLEYPQDALQFGLINEIPEHGSKASIKKELQSDDSVDDGKNSCKDSKSLAKLSQQFLQVFLVGHDILSLPQASDRIQGATSVDELAAIGSASTPSSVPLDPKEYRAAAARGLKTKIRRLYDIANVFLSVGLLRKTDSMGIGLSSTTSRRPNFQWAFHLKPKEIQDIYAQAKNGTKPIPVPPLLPPDVPASTKKALAPIVAKATGSLVASGSPNTATETHTKVGAGSPCYLTEGRTPLKSIGKIIKQEVQQPANNKQVTLKCYNTEDRTPLKSIDTNVSKEAQQPSSNTQVALKSFRTEDGTHLNQIDENVTNEVQKPGNSKLLAEDKTPLKSTDENISKEVQQSTDNKQVTLKCYSTEDRTPLRGIDKNVSKGVQQPADSKRLVEDKTTLKSIDENTRNAVIQPADSKQVTSKCYSTDDRTPLRSIDKNVSKEVQQPPNNKRSLVTPTFDDPVSKTKNSDNASKVAVKCESDSSRVILANIHERGGAWDNNENQPASAIPMLSRAVTVTETNSDSLYI